MKKLLVASIIIFAPFALMAQDLAQLPGGNYIDRGIVNGIASILVLYLIISLILSVIRSIQEYRLRSKLIDKGVSEKVVEQFLQPQSKDIKSSAFKWFVVLGGLGLGLSLVSITEPLGIHSAAIMAFSIALSFLCYYFFVKKSTV